MEQFVRSAGTVLVVDDDELIVDLVAAVLEQAGYEVTTAADGDEALARIAEVLPDVVLSDVNMPVLDGFGLLARVRADSRARSVPFVFLTTRGDEDDLVFGLGLGADDYLRKPIAIPELLARVRAKVERPPVPAELVSIDRSSGLVSREAFAEEARRELARAARTGRGTAVAVVRLQELDTVRARFGVRAVDQVVRQLGSTLAVGAGPLEIVGRVSDTAVAVLLPETGPLEADRRLRDIAESVARRSFSGGGASLRLTPVVGWATGDDADDGEGAVRRAGVAADAASAHLDLVPVRWVESLEGPGRERPKGALRRLLARYSLPIQITVTFLVMVAVPYVVYAVLDGAGHDITGYVYVLVLLALLVTAASIWIEGLLALRPVVPPEEPGAPWPPASAIIAAYLPNEAPTLMETVDAFLAVDYPAPIQVILAYNSPVAMPIEDELRAVAARDPRFVPFRVEGSTSKAQNVNAALALVEGAFTGVFDADHLPATDTFRRAWRWLSNGYDVVQGHPVVRNGDASWVARTVAVEFEAIYAVSHPGRTRLHGFGIFGGSNGYWRTDLLREIRMRGSMLTEDIDSALRAVERGGRIASDPRLVSRELAPTTLQALWNQRMRWAQGWFQVSLRHLFVGMRSRDMTARQKLGFAFLLGWRELYPWISAQMFPIIAYWIVRGGRNLDWFVPVFVLTTVFTLSVGPGQVLFAWRLGDPEIRARRRWYVWYLIASTVFYTELKNLIARVAQFKELMGERAWKVTPRQAPTPGRGNHG